MEHATKLASAFQSDPIIEIALEDGGNFTVQRALLCHTSQYFRSALLGGWAEASDKRLRLPGFDTASFELLLYWICTSKLPDLRPECNELKSIHIDHPQEYVATVAKNQGTLVQLWYGAGMLLMPALQNATMDCLLDVLESCWIGPAATNQAFDMGSSDCIMRLMLLHEMFTEMRSQGRKLSASTADAFGSIPGFFLAYLDAEKNLDPYLMSATQDKQLRCRYMVSMGESSGENVSNVDGESD